MAHSPAFQFYPGDFTGDRLTIPMTTLEVGAYWLLICECWEKGNQLPNDLGELADIARMKLGEFTKVWDRRIKKCFQFDERKNFYWHKRLAKEIKKQKEWSKKKSEAGKKGMASRYKDKSKDPNTTITVLGSDITQPNSPSLSLSSSSSQEKEEETHIPAFAFPVGDFLDAFPDLQLTPSQVGMIEATVKPADRECWLSTIRLYQANHNPATKSYLPERVGTVLDVFKDQKRKAEKNNGTHKQQFTNSGDRNAQRISEREQIVGALLAGDGTEQGLPS